MAVTMPWSETIIVGMSLGFLVNKFTLDDATLGVLNSVGVLEGELEALAVTQYVQSVDITRGRSANQNEIQAGVATITLNNNDRRFDPINTASPYWDATTNDSGVQPRRFVEIKSNDKFLFVGAITAITIEYSSDFSTCIIEAADDFTRLANMTIGTALTPTVEISGTRVTRILDLTEVDYPSDQRDIATGGKSLQALLIDAETNVLTYLQQCALADQALLFMSRAGNLTYTDPISTVWNYDFVSTFTDGVVSSGVIPYTNIATITDQTFLYNRVTVAKEGGTEFTSDDATSQASYGIQTYSLTGLLLNANADAEALSAELLSKYRNPVYRFDDLQFIYNAQTVTNQTYLSELEIGNNIKIIRTFATGLPLSVALYYQVERVGHTISTGAHTCTVGLGALKTVIYQLILDDLIYAVLDSSNALS